MKAARQTFAFTVVELAIVIGVVALFGCMLLPALARTGANTHSITCLNNLRQLMVGWKMYADDNQGRLAPNCDCIPKWVSGWLDLSPLNYDNTNVNLLIDPAKSVLGPYIRSAPLFKCPADKSGVTIAGNLLPRVRSVSMNSWVGEGAIAWGGENFRSYQKTSDIVSPAPANLWVLIDEHEGSINDGALYTDPGSVQSGSDRIIDFPASRHDRACGISFADGRAELHAWRDPRTCPPFNPGVALALNISSPHNVDVEWLVARSTSPP